MKFGFSLSGLLQHTGDGDMVARFADVVALVRLAREPLYDYIYAVQHSLTHPYPLPHPVASPAPLPTATCPPAPVTTLPPRLQVR